MLKFSLQPDIGDTKEHLDQQKGIYTAHNPINPIAIVASKYGLNLPSIKRDVLEGMRSPVMPPGEVSKSKFISPSSKTATRPSEKLTSSCHKTLFAAVEGRFTSSFFQGDAIAPESRSTSPSFQSRSKVSMLNPCSSSVKITASVPGGRFVSPSSHPCKKTNSTPDGRFNSSLLSFPLPTGASGNRFSLPTARAFTQTTASSIIVSGVPGSRLVRAPRSSFSSTNSQKIGGTQENRFITASGQVGIGAQENNNCTSAPFQNTLGTSDKKFSPLAVLRNQSRFSWVSPHVKDGNKTAGKTILTDSSNGYTSNMRSSKGIKELEPNRINLSQVTAKSLNESSKVQEFNCGGTSNNTNVSPISRSCGRGLTSTMLSGKCMCQRSPKVVLCRACGSLMKGRMRRQCSQHPNQIFLMDLTCCCHCQSSNLTEICDSEKEKKST